MGLITGYETVTASLSYYMCFNIEGKDFTFTDQGGGEKDSQLVLRISKDLRERGIEPKIEMHINYYGLKALTEKRKIEYISIERLEEIVKTGNIPKKEFPIVVSQYDD